MPYSIKVRKEGSTFELEVQADRKEDIAELIEIAKTKLLDQKKEVVAVKAGTF